MNCDIIIIGAGPAGLSAALYAKRYGLTPIVLEETIYGGQVVNTPEVENYPGIKHISGAELSMSLYEQVAALGVEVRLEGAVSCELTAPLKTVTTAAEVFTAPAVIIANGARRRKLECEGEERLSGHGVSYCATCDGSFYRGKKVVIVGGGNTALEDALFLANLCSEVHLIHRRNEFRGNKILVDALLGRENIIVHYDSIVTEILGENTVSAVTLQNVKTHGLESLSASGVFVAVGLVPENTLFAEQTELDPAGYIVAGENCRTSLKGVYAAGDTRTKALRQIITAAADGAVAAFEAANMINENR
ncbi:MAG: thioredoxin-disulfide reductase [Angelakisella sp.]